MPPRSPLPRRRLRFSSGPSTSRPRRGANRAAGRTRTTTPRGGDPSPHAPRQSDGGRERQGKRKAYQIRPEGTRQAGSRARRAIQRRGGDARARSRRRRSNDASSATHRERHARRDATRRGGAPRPRGPRGRPFPLLDSPVLPEGPVAPSRRGARRRRRRPRCGNAAAALAFPGVPETFAAALVSPRGARTAPRRPGDGRARRFKTRRGGEIARGGVGRRRRGGGDERRGTPPRRRARARLPRVRASSPSQTPRPRPCVRRRWRCWAPHAAPGTEGLPRARRRAADADGDGVGVFRDRRRRETDAARRRKGAAEDSDPLAVTERSARGSSPSFAQLPAPRRSPPSSPLRRSWTTTTATLSRRSSWRGTISTTRIAPPPTPRGSRTVSTRQTSRTSSRRWRFLRYLSHGAASVRDAAVGAFAASVAALGGGAGARRPCSPNSSRRFPRRRRKTRRDGRRRSLRVEPTTVFSGRRTDARRGRSRRSRRDRPRARRGGGVAHREDLPLVSTFLTKVLADEDETVRDAADGGRTGHHRTSRRGTRATTAGVYEGYLERNAGSGLSDAQSDNVRRESPCSSARWRATWKSRIRKSDRSSPGLSPCCPRPPRLCSGPCPTACPR